jgi:YhcH/YjgK/YiaL family protein
MALFGKLQDLRNQIKGEAFEIALNYLESIGDEFFKLQKNECIKEVINPNMFVLKQAYETKERAECFFESHKKYIDIQYMVKGEEIMDVADIQDLRIEKKYDETTDFIQYENKTSNISTLLVKQGEAAIFFPTDAHQPCIQTDKSELIFKAVIKIAIDSVK